MRDTRRPIRQHDPLASPEALLSIFAHLRPALPEIMPKRDKDLIRLRRAMRPLQRYSATDTKRGRPSQWRREDLLSVSTRLEGDIGA